MAPKRQRVSNASSSRANEATPQVEEEQDIWTTTLGTYQSRPIIQERGIVIESPFEDYIKAQGWLKFVDANTNLYNRAKGIVHDVYTALQIKGRNKIKMNGRTLDLSSDAINALFELQVTGDDEYTKFINSEFDIKEVMQELTGQPRDLSPNWIKFPKAWLVPKTRLLNQFVSSSLMSISCHSSVAKKRALLMYAVCKGMTINVRRIINAELHAMTKTPKKTQVIGFSSLITTLCVKVEILESFEKLDQVTLMKDLRMQDFTNGLAHEEEAVNEDNENLEGLEHEQVEDEDRETEGRDNEEGRQGSQDPWINKLDAKVKLLRMELCQYHEEMRSNQEQFNYFVRYTVAFNTWIANGHQGAPLTFSPLRPLSPS